MPEGPLLLTSITPEQLSPDYWINRLQDPDRVLKTAEELGEFNDDIHLSIPQEVDIFRMDLKQPSRPLQEQLEREYETVRGRILFGVDNHRILNGLFEREIRPRMQWEKMPPTVRVKWGVVTRPTSVRALPSDVKMLEEIGDIEFDQLQFSLIKFWTPVAILHSSSDGEWFYLQAPYVRGWAKAKDIALFRNRDELLNFAKSKDFLVVTGESIPFFRDPEMTVLDQRPSMGTILPPAGKTLETYVVWRPVRGPDGWVRLLKGYVSLKADISVGFLPYTQRNVIRQAFKLLGARYGWGGMYNGRDCSGFTHDVFLPFGIDMPRGSKEQAFVGTQVDNFRPMQNAERKAASIRSATPGVTLLRMPLHQMLYLGEVNGQFYAIHSTWAERISMESDLKKRINQVVVSDLTLNGNSYLGSLFDRIISVSEVD